MRSLGWECKLSGRSDIWIKGDEMPGIIGISSVLGQYIHKVCNRKIFTDAHNPLIPGLCTAFGISQHEAELYSQRLGGRPLLQTSNNPLLSLTLVRLSIPDLTSLGSQTNISQIQRPNVRRLHLCFQSVEVIHHAARTPVPCQACSCIQYHSGYHHLFDIYLQPKPYDRPTAPSLKPSIQGSFYKAQNFTIHEATFNDTQYQFDMCEFFRSFTFPITHEEINCTAYSYG